MKRTLALLGLGLVVTLLVARARPNDTPPPPSVSLQDMLGKSGGNFTPVDKPRKFSFPADHGAHPGFRSEWWYTTGNLADRQGRHYGFELTIFRQALSDRAIQSHSHWAANQAYMAHLAVTDVDGKRFLNTERLSRGSMGLAGAQTNPVRIWLEDWSFEQTGRDRFALKAQENGFGFDLALSSVKPPVLQGDHGWSHKGDSPGESSYYYSLERVATTGNIVLDGKPREVSGLSWVDREFSSQPLAKDLRGWDWFALQLDDHTELMAYFLRRADGSYTRSSGASICHADGTSTWLGADALSLEVTDHWRSPSDGTLYPSGWILKAQGRSYRVKPLLANQELAVSARYWEGAVAVTTADHAGKEIAGAKGTGYVELVGYTK